MSSCAQPSQINEFDICGLEAILAGTLCLMSAYSHGNCDNANNQGLMSLKIISNLTCLQCQKNLSPEFRRILAKVCESWQQHNLLAHAQAVPASSSTTSPASLWHSPPQAMQ
jgi:hypothetical protein